MSNLLPCPFCGGNAGRADGEFGTTIVCDNDACAVSAYVSLGQADDAVSAWNTRAALGDAGWQDISTAPKDREILVCGGTRRDESFDYGGWDPFTDVALAQYDKRKDCWEGEQTEQYELFILYKPTHWQDKPKPYSVTRHGRDTTTDGASK